MRFYFTYNINFKSLVTTMATELQKNQATNQAIREKVRQKLQAEKVLAMKN